MALSDAKLRTLKTTGGTYKVYDGGGLYLEVSPSGARLWRFRYRAHGKDKRLALGSYPETSLASARKKRDEGRRLLSEGLDPAMERKRDKLVAAFKAANSFGDVAKEYIEKMVADGRAEATTVKTPAGRRGNGGHANNAQGSCEAAMVGQASSEKAGQARQRRSGEQNGADRLDHHEPWGSLPPRRGLIDARYQVASRDRAGVNEW